jgi:hypothetical protein
MDTGSNYSSAERSVDTRQESVVQFGGRWEMDLHASDSLDAVLTAFGVPWLLRKLLDNLPVHQEIVQGRDSLTIAITTWLKTATLELVISSPLARDAVTTHSASGPLGTDVPTHSVWVAGGEALLTTQECSQPRQTQRLLFCTERRCALFVLCLFCVWFRHYLLLLYYLAGQIASEVCMRIPCHGTLTIDAAVEPGSTDTMYERVFLGPAESFEAAEIKALRVLRRQQ